MPRDTPEKNVCFIVHRDLFTPHPILRAAKEIEVLQDAGHRVSAVCWIKKPEDLPESDVQNDVEIHRVFQAPPRGSGLSRFRAYLDVTKRLADEVMALKPDALVPHDLEVLRAAVLVRKRTGVPVFYDSHEDYPAMIAEHNPTEARAFAWLERRWLRHVEHTYTVSRGIETKFERLGAPVSVLYNSKTLDGAPKKSDGSYSELKRECGLDDGDFVLGFVGGLNRLRGIEVTISALGSLPEDVKLMVVGGGPYDREDPSKDVEIERLTEVADDEGVSGRVVFTGRVPNQRVLEYVCVFDVGTTILPLLGENYLFRGANKQFDYMAAGIPQVVSGFGDMKAIVVDECDCGLPVDPQDRESIVVAVKGLYDDRELAKRLGANGRKWFESTYCWERQVEKLKRTHPIWTGGGG